MVFLLFFALVSGFGYYLWPQTIATFSVVFLVALAAQVGAWWRGGRFRFEGGDPRGWWMPTVIGVSGWIFTLQHAATTAAERGPWDVVPLATVLWLGIPLGIGVWMKSPKALLLVLGASVWATAFLFPLGFGFDPFVHEATLHHLLQYGDITPKQPYYAAFYGIFQGFAHFLPVSLHAVVQYGIPALTLVLFWRATHLLPREDRFSWALALLFFPLAIVTQSTPYALGTLFLLFALVSGWQQRNLLFTLAVGAALLTHPIPGVLAACVGPIVFFRSRWWSLSLVGAFLGIPLLFCLQAALGQGVAFTWQPQVILQLFPLATNSAYTPWADLTFLIGANRWWFAMLLGAVGAALAGPTFPRRFALVGFFTLSSGVLLASTLHFVALPAYEQLDYAQRLVALSSIFFLPAISVFFTSLVQKLPRVRDRWPLAALAGLVACSVFLAAYPRHDAYARFGGITVSAADYTALAALEALHPNEPYVVIAHQSMSAAALQTYGFVGRYVDGQYFYPIPTGSTFGLLAIDILQKGATPERLATYALFAPQATHYVVVHDFWNLAPQLHAQLAPASTTSLSLAPGVTAYRIGAPLVQ